jgi:hypothetical protein
MAEPDEAAVMLAKLKEMIQTMRTDLTNDLEVARKEMAMPKNWDELSPLAVSDASPHRCTDAAHYLHPLAKWPKIRDAPQCTPMTEMLRLATYPHRPEETRLVVALVNGVPSYGVVTRWQCGQRVSRHALDDEISEDEDDGEVMANIKRKGVMDSSRHAFECLIALLIHRTTATEPNLWTREYYAALDESVKQSLAWERQYDRVMPTLEQLGMLQR